MKLTQNISYMCFKLSSTGSPCSKLVYKMSFFSAHFSSIHCQCFISRYRYIPHDIKIFLTVTLLRTGCGPQQISNQGLSSHNSRSHMFFHTKCKRENLVEKSLKAMTSRIWAERPSTPLRVSQPICMTS